MEGQDKERESQKKELYLEILYNIPAGFELTARLTTNYRCLKNIWRQRRDHRLPEWREFCEWIETLPYAKDLICYEKEKDNKVPESTSMDEIMKRLNYLETELQKISFIKQISNSNPLFSPNPQSMTFVNTSMCDCTNNENKKENNYDTL